MYEPLFYVTSLGQTELQGPLIINLTLNTPGNWTEAKPRLVYWDSGKVEFLLRVLSKRIQNTESNYSIYKSCRRKMYLKSHSISFQTILSGEM